MKLTYACKYKLNLYDRRRIPGLYLENPFFDSAWIFLCLSSLTLGG